MLARPYIDHKHHYWAIPNEEKQTLPFVRAVLDHIAEPQIVYESSLFSDLRDAVVAGIAIGPITKFDARELDDLIPLNLKPDPTGESLWFVYHKDLKTNAKIIAFYQLLCRSLNIEESGSHRIPVTCESLGTSEYIE